MSDSGYTVCVDKMPELMTPGEVAALFRVDTKTVAAWAAEGLLTVVRTPGNQRRYYKTEVDAMITAATTPAGPRRD
jgi:excisionase family DNA binding protein